VRTRFDSRFGRLALLLTGFVAVGSVRSPFSISQETPLPFSCDALAPDIDESALRARFGAANVSAGLVPWGGAEGDYNEGTILFALASDARLEIYWRDRANRRQPQWVSVRGTQSRWRSPAGITLGTTLQTIERLNRGPFRLIGFGSDVQGTIISWSGGQLDRQNTSACHVRVRVASHWPPWQEVDPATSDRINQLKGEREYSSGHPAMQALNPRVYELFLQYSSQ
jgi:hypothetical protein